MGRFQTQRTEPRPSNPLWSTCHATCSLEPKFLLLQLLVSAMLLFMMMTDYDNNDGIFIVAASC